MPGRGEDDAIVVEKDDFTQAPLFTPEQLEEIERIADEIAQAKMPRYLRKERVSDETPVTGQSMVWDKDRLKWVPGNATLTANHGKTQHTENGNWKGRYTDGSGDEQEVALGADATILTSTGTSAPPIFEAGSAHAHSHDVLTDVSANDHHTKYTAAEAVADVPFVVYIPFGSEPITGQSYAP